MSEEVGKKRKISDQNGIGSSGNKFITMKNYINCLYFEINSIKNKKTYLQSRRKKTRKLHKYNAPIWTR